MNLQLLLMVLVGVILWSAIGMLLFKQYVTSPTLVAHKSVEKLMLLLAGPLMWIMGLVSLLQMVDRARTHRAEMDELIRRNMEDK